MNSFKYFLFGCLLALSTNDAGAQSHLLLHYFVFGDSKPAMCEIFHTYGTKIGMKVKCFHGTQPFTYKWSTGETIDTIYVNPQETTNYIVTVSNNVGSTQAMTIIHIPTTTGNQ